MVHVKREQILLKRRINFNMLKYVFVISVKIFNSKSIQRMICIEKFLLLKNFISLIINQPLNENSINPAKSERKDPFANYRIDYFFSNPQFYRILHFYAHTFSLLLHLLTNFLSTI